MNRMIKYAAIPAMALMTASGALAADKTATAPDNASPAEMRSGDADVNTAGERPMLDNNGLDVNPGRAEYEQRVPDNASPAEMRSGDAAMNSAGDRPMIDGAESGMRNDGETAELNKESLRDMQEMGREPATGSGEVLAPDNASPAEMRSGDAELNSAGERPLID